MFTAYETKYIKGHKVKKQLGSIKKRLQKNSERLGDHFFYLDEDKAERRKLKKLIRMTEENIKKRAMHIGNVLAKDSEESEHDE